MHAIVGLQRAGGWWELDDALAQVLGVSVATLRAAMPDGTDARVWATAIAITWLERQARWQEDEWRLIVRKARQWLSSTGGSQPSGRLLEAAARVLQARNATV
jgi:hypothetical protein